MSVFLSLSQHHKKLLSVMLLTFIALILSTNANAQYAGGAGTSGDPYQISNVTQLQAVNDNLDGHFILINDIDASDTKNWNSGAGFVQIGSISSQFSGSFNGQDFTIDSLFINRSASRRVGLFGSLSGSVTRVRLTELEITGKQSVGGIVGENFGSISKVSVQGTVTATDVEAGGIVGANAGSVSKSTSKGFVLGSSSNNYGGLVGIMYQNGSITDSYSLATVSVSGGDNIGGLLGRSSSTNSFITNSYAAGSVSGNTTGGLLEDDTGTLTVTQSFWDVQTTGQSSSAAGVGKTTAEMQNFDSFIKANWDYSTTWYQRPGENNGYPQLQAFVVDSGAAPMVSEVAFSGSLVASDTMRVSYTFFDTDGDIDLSSVQWFRSDDASGTNKTAISGATNSLFIPTSAEFGKFISIQVTPKDAFKTGILVESILQGPVISPFPSGSGTEENPYHIETLNQLQAMRFFVNDHFILMNDLDASSTYGWNDGAGFVPIGELGNPFSGTLHGQAYTVSNLLIYRPSQRPIGLFGVTTSSAIISDLRINDANVRGDNTTGVLVGSNFGTLNGCFASGNASARNLLGGLVGSNSFLGRIKQSGSSVKVIVIGNSTIVGGLVGANSGVVNNSYAIGNVAGFESVGGLVGDNYSGTITNSYTTSYVSGSRTTGGLVGFNVGGSIANSFWNTHTAGQSEGVGLGSSTGIAGKTTAEMQQRSTFKDAGWNFSTIWDIDEGESYPFFKVGNDFELTVTGNEGWRMLSTPEGKSTYEDFLFGTWSQGFPGAKSEEGNPSVLLWDEVNRNWTAPGSSADSTARGQGFLTYLFADDNNDGNDEGFPKELSYLTEPDTTSIDIPVSFTNTDSISQDGWNFVGNPFNQTIDWDAAQGFSRTNLSNTFYIWSDSAGGGQGAYLTWNGITGTLPNGKIAPWQGFWVKAVDENPQLNISSSAKSEGGIYRKSEELSQIEITISSSSYQASTILLFDDRASDGLDVFDAYALESLNDATLEIGTGYENSSAMAIQALPVSAAVNLLMPIKALSTDTSMTLSWNARNIDPFAYIELFDCEAEMNYNLSESGSFNFTIEADSVSSADSLIIPKSPIQILGTSDHASSRFQISTDYLAISNENETSIPSTPELSQNYPNPFNPSTTINYGVPKTGQVTLEVFNTLGQKVSTIVNTQQTAGRYNVTFNASNLSSGLYFYRLQTNGKILTEKMMLIK